jgi:hypothetical protein
MTKIERNRLHNPVALSSGAEQGDSHRLGTSRLNQSPQWIPQKQASFPENQTDA